MNASAFNRRTFLRGLGAAIALPWLESLNAATPKNDPRRLACFYIPGGINQYGWYPEDMGPKYTLAASHKPLELSLIHI